MSKLDKLENQIKSMKQWVHCHHVGRTLTVDNAADQHGIDSMEFARVLKQHFTIIERHAIELEVLDWVLSEIEGIKNEPS